MKKALFLFMFCLAAPLSWAQEPIGQVVDLEGDVWVGPEGGRPALATLQSSVRLNDQIETKKTGGVKILFVDETILTVKENSKVLITQFLFNPEAEKRNITLEAAWGRLRTIVTQFVGKDQLVEVKTPAAVAGIRGTDLGLIAEVKKSFFYCFHCEKQEVRAYSREFPSQAVALSTGQAVEILAGQAASKRDIQSIPKDILDRIDILFDIQKGASAASVKDASKNSGNESAAAEEKKLKSAEPDLARKGAESKKDVASTLEKNPQGKDKNAEVMPGGGDESTTGSSVTITLPSK